MFAAALTCCVTMASLDDPAMLPPEPHVWVQDKLPWVVIADARPQFAQSLFTPQPGNCAP